MYPDLKVSNASLEIILDCRIPHSKMPSSVSDTSHNGNSSCFPDTSEYEAKTHDKLCFFPLYIKHHEAIWPPVIHLDKMHCLFSVLFSCLGIYNSWLHCNTTVSLNVSSFGWFNTALMVEGKSYLPWLMDWWVINLCWCWINIFPEFISESLSLTPVCNVAHDCHGGNMFKRSSKGIIKSWKRILSVSYFAK